MLVLQSNGKTGKLTIANGTKAIGNRAVASCKYSEVEFVDDTTIIYGQAFANCLNLQTLTNISHIKYINASVNSPDVEINTKGGNYDQGSTVGSGAFSNCKNLKVNFLQMTSIVKIGDSSFSNCDNIITDVNTGKTYSFYDYKKVNNVYTEVTRSGLTKILDLSTLSNLRYLGSSAFNCGNNTKSVDCAILPNTTSSVSDPSNFKCGSSAIFHNDTVKLVGETAHQADQSSEYKDTLNPTNHYPNGGLNGKYATLYYRIHTYDDCISNITTGRHYWTAVKTGNANQIKIVMFDSKEDVQDWLATGNNDANQCHTFPES